MGKSVEPEVVSSCKLTERRLLVFQNLHHVMAAHMRNTAKPHASMQMIHRVTVISASPLQLPYCNSHQILLPENPKTSNRGLLQETSANPSVAQCGARRRSDEHGRLKQR
jgi:hypothetical protein